MTDSPKVYFEDLPLSEDLLDALYDMRFDVCTPVQAQCIPHILQRRDLIGIAQTGTGKTAAYLLPILTLLQEHPHPDDAVNCLIMAPTRELARQIDQALQGFSYYMNINGVAVYGGNDGERYEKERHSLKRGADIVIATPGRLMTHLQLGSLDLSRTNYFILDEADRMLDMGFYDDIMKIVAALPKERQTILFSATLPDKIDELARTILHDPVEVKLAVSKPAEKIQQSVYVCKDGDKTAIIRGILSEEGLTRTIVFASSKQKVKELNILLRRAGLHTEAMHSDLEQTDRERVMLDFKAGRVDILVATDIVARGIDIDDITMVINYDCPRDPEDYVHRIGRTARAGREGRAITLVNEKDRPALASIERMLEYKITRNPLPEGMSEPQTASHRNDRRGGGNKKRSGHHGRRDGKRNAAPSNENKEQGPSQPAATDGNTPATKKKSRSRHHHRKSSNKNNPATAPNSSSNSSSESSSKSSSNS